jgi:hypothetical protein
MQRHIVEPIKGQDLGKLSASGSTEEQPTQPIGIESSARVEPDNIVLFFPLFLFPSSYLLCLTRPSRVAV